MSLGLLGHIAIVGFNLVLIGLLLRRPAVTWEVGGRVVVVASLFALPAIGFSVGFVEHAERAKQTEFCVSCHVMEPYGLSLRIDSPDHLPAQHAQNVRVSRDQACYVCHTSYTMFGDIRAKLNGLKHVYVNYLGTVPDELTLYEPYQNRECLECHSGARDFEENEFHIDTREELATNAVSCLECHDQAHDIRRLDSLELWDGQS